jgi:hypothetical protein
MMYQGFAAYLNIDKTPSVHSLIKDQGVEEVSRRIHDCHCPTPDRSMTAKCLLSVNVHCLGTVGFTCIVLRELQTRSFKVYATNGSSFG